MTSEEKQEIINAVLAAIKTNSKTVDQLTPVSEMSDTDFLELNGGRKVSYGVLFANHMSNDEAQEAWGYLDTHKVDKDLRGLVEVHQAPVVFLDAMGILDGHALNGSDGLEYRPDYKQIFDFPDGLFGAPKAGAVYISKNNFKKFVWNGTDLEELKADECPLFVDYSEPVAFATLPVGGSYYVPSSNKIAVKIDASSTKTYDPLPDALYFFRDKGMIFTWKSSTNKWVPAGSDIKVVNNLTAGGEADALSAEQGKVLKGLIDNIGTGSISAFTNYAVVESVSALPATGVATTGYIVGNHIYAYVGTGGDTRDGKYQDLGALEAAGVSVTTAEDGTFTIHAGGNDYTVNLNHTHPNMCKLVVCKESGLPSTYDPATIYAITDSGETEIEKLIIRGMEFAGGGGTPSTDPRITSPIGTQIDFNGASTKTVTVRASNLSEALTIAVTGVTANLQTISANDAANGVQLTLTKGQNFATGTLRIYSSEVDKSWSVIDSQGYQSIAAVKFTGSQWVETGVDIGPNTSMKLDMRILNEYGATRDNYHIFSVSNSGFALNTGLDNKATYLFFWIQGVSIQHDFGAGLFTRGVVDYTNGSVSFLGQTFTAATKTSVSTNLAIGKKNDGTAFNFYYLEVYGLEIYESGVLTHKFLPKRQGNIVGLYDTETGNFITSGTSTPLVAVETNN